MLWCTLHAPCSMRHVSNEAHPKYKAHNPAVAGGGQASTMPVCIRIRNASAWAAQNRTPTLGWKIRLPVPTTLLRLTTPLGSATLAQNMPTQQRWYLSYHRVVQLSRDWSTSLWTCQHHQSNKSHHNQTPKHLLREQKIHPC
jgi:hypothetical protein